MSVTSSDRSSLEWSLLCRACLMACPAQQLISVFHVHISRKLMSLAGVQVWPADGLPARICRDCLVKLDVSFQFKRQCERADQTLRQLQHQNQEQPHQHHTLQQQQPHQHLQLLPSPSAPVQSNDMPLSDSILTDLSHSVPPSLKNHSDLLAHTLLNSDINQIENMKTEKKGYRCKTCFKVFDTSTKLSRHIYVHSGQKPFKCDICKKAFSHNSNLKAHMKLHSDDRPFVCTICQKGCKRSKDLEMHMRTHTGEKPHVCNNCGKAFSSSSNLIAHYRTHTGEKPYVCSICQKAFCQSNELSKHKKIHVKEKHVCEICNKSFSSSSALIVHVMNHNDERPNNCNICFKSFSSSTSLTAHLKKHELGELDF